MSISKQHLDRASSRLTEHFPDVGQLRQPDTPGSYVPGSLNPITDTPGAVIWEGPCWLTETVNTAATEIQSGAAVQVDTHRVRLPKNAPLPSPGDVFELLSSAHDPHAAGFTAQVTDIVVGTGRVSRLIGLRSAPESGRVD